MNTHERGVLQSHLLKLVPMERDLGAVIQRMLALTDDIPPENKGGDALRMQLRYLTQTREHVQRAMRDFSGALEMGAPDV